jgi:hypothetical protein
MIYFCVKFEKDPLNIFCTLVTIATAAILNMAAVAMEMAKMLKN